MDNRRRPLQEYFDAARGEPGITEQEVRRLAEGGSDGGAQRGSGRGGGKPWRSLVSFTIGGAVLITLAAWYLFATHAPEPGRAAEPRSIAGPARPQVAAIAGNGGMAPAAAPDSSRAAVTSAQPAIGRDVVAARTASTVQQSIHRENTMISIRDIRDAAMAIAVMSAATISAQAQQQPSTIALPHHDGTMIAHHEDQSPMMKQLHAELGQTVVDYWMPKLNDYKVRLDRMLTASDLDDLNRLRVRFNVLANTWLQSGKEGRQEFIEQEKEELTTIYKSVRAMADRYRPTADVLGQSVMEDIGAFFPAAIERVDGFSAAHRKEIDEAGKSDLIAKARDHMNQVAQILQQGQGKLALGMIYPAGIEPVLMLYDGTDLKTLLHHLEQLAMGKGASAMTSGAIAGYVLPDEKLLGGCVPNPASASAAITYNLSEPSSHTLLRLFNARGDLAGTYDQGAQPAGDHQVTMDLSALPAGTYLYHLTIETAKGERVASKTLQVVR